MLRRTLALMAVGLLLLSLAPTATAATEMCMYSYEDRDAGGDSLVICSTPTSIHIPNLGTHSEGLHGGGCNGPISPGPTWNNCISSIKVTNVPLNYRAVWYFTTNYGGVTFCLDRSDNFNVWNMGGLVNDSWSSLRVLGGNCP